VVQHVAGHNRPTGRRALPGEMSDGPKGLRKSASTGHEPGTVELEVGSGPTTSSPHLSSSKDPITYAPHRTRPTPTGSTNFTKQNYQSS